MTQRRIVNTTLRYHRAKKIHLYSGLQSLLEVHVTSKGCYSEIFHLDESTSKLLLFAASQTSLHFNSQCLLHTFLWSLCTHFWKRVSHFNSCSASWTSLAYSWSTRQTSFSLSLSLVLCLAHFSRPVLAGLANFFLSLLFFCLPTVVYKIVQRQTYHKKHDLCQVLH